MGLTDLSGNFFKEVGAAIKKRRVKRDLTLEKLGLEVGLTRMQIHRIETGYNITLKTLLKLAIALETSPSKLIKSKTVYKKEHLEKLVNSSKGAKSVKKSKDGS